MVLFTHIGQLTLDGEAIFFEESVHGAFSAAGFEVDFMPDSRRRRLLGVVDVLGLFNVLQDAAASDPTAPPAPFIPTQFVAEVKRITYCEGGGDCQRPDGQLADHVLPMNDGKKAMVAHEDQVLMLDPNPEKAGKYLSRTEIKKLQYPGQLYTKLRNETHLLEFATFDGTPYHCHLLRDGELGEQVKLFNQATSRRTAIGGEFEKLFLPLLADRVRKPRKTAPKSTTKRRMGFSDMMPEGSGPAFGPPVMSGETPHSGSDWMGDGTGSGTGSGDYVPSWEDDVDYFSGTDPYGSGGPMSGGFSGSGAPFAEPSGSGPPIGSGNQYYDPDLVGGFGIDPSPPPQPPPVEYATEFLGFDSVDGVYCKKFEITAYRDGNTMVYTFWGQASHP